MNSKLSQLVMKGQVMAVLFGSVVLLHTSCAENTKNTDRKQDIPVKVFRVETSATGMRQDYVGTVEEIFSSSLSFEVAGNVSEIYVREGQQIRKGQPMATLNKATLQNNYDAALSVLKQAEDAYARMKTLHDSNSLPEIKWVETQTALQQAKSLESIALKSLNDCCLYAPFSGVVTKRNIESGTNVMPGMPAFTLVATDKVKIKIAVPEKEIHHTHIGQAANIRIAALGDKQLQAKISEKNITANPLSHTYEVKIALDNPNGDLMPGMVCNVDIEREDLRKDEITLPPGTIQVSHTGENFVWLAINNQAQRRVVTTGGFYGNAVIISGGLTAGEQVITEGNQKVSEGMKISIQ